MVVYCCVGGCSNDWKPQSDVKFHRFPLTNIDLLEKWIKALGLEELAVKSHSRVCSSHFSLKDYYDVDTPGKRMILKPNAIPNSTLTSRLFKNQSEENLHLKEKKIEFQLTHFQNPVNDIINTHSPKDGTQKIEIVANSNILASVKKTVSLHGASTQTSSLDISVESSSVKDLWRRKIKILQQKLRRRDLKITTMRKHIVNLRNKETASRRVINVLKKHFDGFSAELFRNQYKNCKVKPKQRRYSEALKRFSVKLYSNSPSAYKFVRTYLQLPHFRTLLRKQTQYQML